MRPGQLRVAWALLALLLCAWLALALYDSPPGPTGGWLADAGLVPQVVRLAGVDVRYVRSGSGPPLLLLHGFASSIFTWRDVLPALAREHDVVALDLPGFGRSEIPPELPFALFPRVVLGLLDRLGLARASVVGHSLGGAVAVMLAAGSPERVERLVLIDSAGFNLAPGDQPLLVRLSSFEPVGVAAEFLPVKRALVTLGLREVFHDRTRVTRERVDEYLEPVRRPGFARGLLSLTRSRGSADVELPSMLRLVAAPTLLLWGREDRWAPVAQAERFQAGIRGARLIVLGSCGHMPQEEKPAETGALVAAFLRTDVSR